jgi:hypothetical protein
LVNDVLGHNFKTDVLTTRISRRLR